MHDPDVVAFTIRRPWPRRRRTLPGRRYWPPLVTVWHREPRGHDAGTVCRHYDRVTCRVLHGWRLHIWHYHLQIHPLQALRRWALTRCAWCGGRSVKGDRVNFSQWDREPGRWWWGEQGLFHHDCSAVESAHRSCVCDNPIHEHELSGYSYGRCVKCGRSRAWKTTPGQLERHRLLAAIPAGGRDAAVYKRVCELAKAEKDRTGGET